MVIQEVGVWSWKELGRGLKLGALEISELEVFVSGVLIKSMLIGSIVNWKHCWCYLKISLKIVPYTQSNFHLTPLLPKKSFWPFYSLEGGSTHYLCSDLVTL